MTFDRRKQAVRSEVERLASALLDQQLTAQKMGRLQSLLASDVVARECFVDCMTLHTLLEARHEAKLDSTANSDFERLAQEVLRESSGGEVAPSVGKQSDHALVQTTSPRVLPFYLALTLAVCLLVAGSIGVWLAGTSFSGASKASPYVGILSQAVGVRWSAESGPISVPARLAAGQRLSLESGFVELAFSSGCTCALQGPAEVELVSPMCVRAAKGALWARVGEEAKGFVIETPTATVVDLGTEFGVNVDNARITTDVVVFEGAVDLQVTAARFGVSDSKRRKGRVSSTRLTSGEALRVGQSGIARRITAVSSEQYPRLQRSPESQYRSPVIGGVADNIRDANATKYYQIVRAGLYDDTRAYVDRKHEWNGVDAGGIPSILRGADYVMCFNSDKWSSELKISVDIVAPARLFVFFDDRLPTPTWLAENFKPTPYKIGVDEGYGNAHIAPQTTAYGPGESIDTMYSVWQADVVEPRTVELGALPKSGVEVSMYGIAAIPLEDAIEMQPVPPQSL